MQYSLYYLSDGFPHNIFANISSRSLNAIPYYVNVNLVVVVRNKRYFLTTTNTFLLISNAAALINERLRPAGIDEKPSVPCRALNIKVAKRHNAAEEQ